MDNWILTSERNPEQEGNYLVWMPRLEEEPVIRDWDWGEWYNDREIEEITGDVTHWQSLPSPPNTTIK